MTEAEKKYSTTEREELAVYQGGHYFRSYLEDKELEIRTDHLPLTYVFNKGYGNTRIQRWALYLSKYSFKIQYKKRLSLNGPDALSRIQNPEERNEPIGDLPNLDDSLFPSTPETPKQEEKPAEISQRLR